jgi:RhtB (resistance to homoserine/threonine) family protein
LDHLPLLGTVAVAHLLGAMSPGPDFVLALRNSLRYGRRAGFWTAVGFGCGVAVHAAYCAAGLALLIARTPLLFKSLQLVGAFYLAWVGGISLFARSGDEGGRAAGGAGSLPALKALGMGFLTNILNPKATLFILSLFTLVVAPGTPAPVLVAVGAVMVLDTVLWFSLVAACMTRAGVRAAFDRRRGLFDKALGAVLLQLAGRLVWQALLG